MLIFTNMPVPIFNALKLRVGIFFIAISLLCSSCAQPPAADLPEPEELPPSRSLGDELFLNENFAEALIEYGHAYETAIAPEDQSQALYGLACTQLVLAYSDIQMTEAIGNLEKWDDEKGDTPLTENRHLFVTALKSQVQRILKLRQEQTHLAKQKNNVIANQRKKITQMANTVDNLQKQLEELEAIDETLQEKKKPL
jgi:hypothetical protein